MANQLGSLSVAPREYSKHQRHGNLARRRHDDQINSFLGVQATRLSSTAAVVYAKVTKYGAAHVKAAANLAALP
jgi:hypothetical protein